MGFGFERLGEMTDEMWYFGCMGSVWEREMLGYTVPAVSRRRMIIPDWGVDV